MIKNDLELDLKSFCIEQNIKQREIAEAIGERPQYVNKIINHRYRIVNDVFVRILEVLGYDIELNYVKQDKK